MSKTIKHFQDGPLQGECSYPSLTPTDEFSGGDVPVFPAWLNSVMRKVFGRRIYLLDEDLVLRIWGPGYSARFLVPRGFRTDFASIPVIFMPIIGQADRFLISSIIHDYFCVKNYPGFFANSSFRYISRLTKVANWRCRWAYFAVELFGYASPISGWLTRRNIRGVSESNKE